MPAPISAQLPPKLATSSITFSLAGSLHVSVEHQHYKSGNAATSSSNGTDVVNPKSIWRQPLAVRARGEKIDGLVIDAMPAERSLKNISCLATHNLKSCFGVADTHTAKYKNVFKIMDHSYQVLNSFQQPDEFIDLSWQGDILLGSSYEGIVYCYRINLDSPSETVQPAQAYTHTILSSSSHNNSSSSSSAPAAARLSMPEIKPNRIESAINRVLLQPDIATSFISLENKSFHLWMLEHAQKPLYSVKGLKANVVSADWNAVSKEHFAIGKSSGMLALHDHRLLDSTRTSKIWRNKRAHNGSIREVKWNPLVSHWLASAGDDGNICIWDLRYGSRPIFVFQEHSNVVTKLSWSRVHPEILVSGGDDRTVQLHSLSLPSHLLASYSGFTHHLVGVSFSMSEAFKLFGASANGEITSLSMKPTFLEPLAPHKFSEDKKAEREIETDIYLRDFHSACKKLVDLGNKYKTKGGDVGAKSVISLLPLAQLVYPKSKAVETWNDSGDATFSEFQQSLFEETYRVPFAFPKRLSISQPDYYISQQVDTLKLSIQLQIWQEECNYAELISSTKDIIKLLKSDRKALNADTLRNLIRGLETHDFNQALDFGITLMEVFKEGTDEDYKLAIMPICYSLLYPTIFDDIQKGDDISSYPANYAHISSSKTSKQVEATLKPFEAEMIKQLHFLRDFIRAQASGAQGISNTIKLYSEFKKNHKVLSSILIRNYFHLLIQAQRFDVFYEEATSVAQDVENTGFYSAIKSMMTLIALPKLKTCLKDFAKRDKSKPWMTKNLSKALKISLRIVINANRFLPLDVFDLASNTLKTVTRSIRKGLGELLKKPEPGVSQVAAEAQVQRKATYFAKKLQKLIAVNKLPDNIQAQVTKLSETLNGIITNPSSAASSSLSSSSSSKSSSSSLKSSTKKEKTTSSSTPTPTASATTPATTAPAQPKPSPHTSAPTIAPSQQKAAQRRISTPATITVTDATPPTTHKSTTAAPASTPASTPQPAAASTKQRSKQ